MFEPLTFEKLRWEYTTSKLIEFAKYIKIDISKCNLKNKRKLAKFIWQRTTRGNKNV